MSEIGSLTIEVILWTIHILEGMGYVVIVYSASAAFLAVMKDRSEMSVRKCRLNLAEGLATALEFKLAGEILRTVIVRTPEELILLGAIVALRVVMALMIYWEMKQEKEAHS